MDQTGHATLVVDPHNLYSAYSVVITDEWGNVVHRTFGFEAIGLAAETPVRRRRKPSLGVLQRRTKNEADRLTEILKAMLDLDRNAARQTIDALVTQFTDLFDETSGAVIGRTRSRPRAPARTRDNLPMAA